MEDISAYEANLHDLERSQRDFLSDDFKRGWTGFLGMDNGLAQQQAYNDNLIDRAYNALEAAKSRNFNSEEAQKQRDYEERLSNTAYQRAYADMRSASLNPYLMYNQGGSSTPSGASASGASASSSATSYHSTGSSGSGIFSSFVNSVVSAFQIGQQSKQFKQELAYKKSTKKR